MMQKKKKEKLHFTILNYTSNYILHSKQFKCKFCTLNNDPCYTLHPDIKFVVNLNRKIWHHVKRLNCPSSQFFKNKDKYTLPS